MNIKRGKTGSRRAHRSAAWLLSACALAGQAFGADTPDEIVTDRPDFVESSEVVGKGRVQLETGLSIERNRADGVTVHTLSTPTLLRIGLSDAWELRFETDGIMRQRTAATVGAAQQTERGVADLSVGVKWHMMDAVGALPSMALLAHLDVESGSAGFRGNGLRPSLRLASEWELPGDLSLGVMPGVILDRDQHGRRYTAGIVGIVLGKAWNERLHTFVEIAAPQIARARDGGSQLSLDIGMGYLITPLIQFDMALSRGLNKNTADLTLSIGLSRKF